LPAAEIEGIVLGCAANFSPFLCLYDSGPARAEQLSELLLRLLSPELDAVFAAFLPAPKKNGYRTPLPVAKGAQLI
jgi:hypothetical protein